MSRKREYKTLAVKVTPQFGRVVEKYMEKDAHVTVSDLLRDALREKIRNEAPELYSEMFKAEVDKK